MSVLIIDVLNKILILSIKKYRDYAKLLLVSKNTTTQITRYIRTHNIPTFIKYELLLPQCNSEYIREWVESYVCKPKPMYKCVSIIYTIDRVADILKKNGMSHDDVPNILIIFNKGDKYIIKTISYMRAKHGAFMIGTVYPIYNTVLMCSRFNYIILYDKCIETIFIDYHSSKFAAAQNKHYKFICDNTIRPRTKNA